MIGAGGAYTFGAATVGVTYSNIRFANLGSYVRLAVPAASATFNNARNQLQVSVDPGVAARRSIRLHARRGHRGASRAQYHQGALGVDYFLSKRTDVYVIGVYQHALGDTTRRNRQRSRATAPSTACRARRTRTSSRLASVSVTSSNKS